jgi:organic hydroperoxide reductase OsmC/OhrA
MAFKQRQDERHEYAAKLVWSGASKGPTSSYQAYSRDHEARVGDRPALVLSADAHFRGDPALYNPEELLVVALSSCHLLSYLAECARAGVHVMAYEDDAQGVMSVSGGKLRFTSVVLRPRVTIAAAADVAKATELHHDAHASCFIANSVNFPVTNEPEILVAP